MCRCVREDETYDIFCACHDEPYGEYFASKRKILNILTIGYYWSTLHKDASRNTEMWQMPKTR